MKYDYRQFLGLGKMLVVYWRCPAFVLRFRGALTMDRSLFLPVSKVGFTHMSQSHALVTLTDTFWLISKSPRPAACGPFITRIISVITDERRAYEMYIQTLSVLLSY